MKVGTISKGNSEDHHRSAVDGAVFSTGQILVYLVHSWFEFYLEFGHFPCLNILEAIAFNMFLNPTSPINIAHFLLAGMLLQLG